MSRPEAASQPAEDSVAELERTGGFDAPPSFAALWPFEVDRFLREFWSRRPCVVRGSATDFEFLMPWNELNGILYSRRLEELRVRMVKEEKRADPALYSDRHSSLGGGAGKTSLDPVRTARLLRDGFTLAIDEIDHCHPPIDELARSFENELGEKAQANLYACWSQARAFQVHWDDHDVYVLQVHGCKRWLIYGRLGGNAAYFGLHGVEPEPPPTEATWEGLLRPGDLLYLPRGTWHAAQTEDGETLHVGFAVENRTGVSFLRWLADAMLKSEFARGDIPFHASAEDQERYCLRLEREVGGKITGDALQEYRHKVLGSLRERLRHNLPVSVVGSARLSDDVTLTWNVYRNCRATVEGDSLRILAYGNTYRLPADMSEIIGILQESHAIVLGELAARAEVDRDRLDLFVTQLAHLGLLRVTFPPTSARTP